MNDESIALEPGVLESLPAVRALIERLSAGKGASVGGAWGSSQAMLLAAIAPRVPAPLVCVLASEAEAEAFALDLAAFGLEPARLPARHSTESGLRATGADPRTIRDRLQAAQLLAGPPERRPRLLVASLLSLLQPVPTPEELEGEYLHLQRGGRLRPDDLLERLVAGGYAREPLAESPGEVSLRGDILDLYPFVAELPLRVELFDDEIESMRTFDPESQRSIEELSRASVCLASDAGGVEDGAGALPARFFAPTAILVDVEPLRIAETVEGLRVRSSGHARALGELAGERAARRSLALQSLPSGDLDLETRSVQALSVGMREAHAALADLAREGVRVRVLCAHEGERDRFRASLAEDERAEELARVETAVASVARGFRIPELGLVVVNHRELIGVLGRRRVERKQPRHRVKALESFFELRRGDLVVHAVHGLARFVGLERMTRGGGEEDHLHLVFADDVSLFVPASRIDLVQRYIGTGSAAPALDKIGGASFRKRRERVERALEDLAAELIEVQAKRELLKRPAWEPDAELVRQLLASFPYEDTGDQRTVDGEIARDLASERPMDRLLCGDVGFGKTELAVRAAFRVVSAGAQVAVLVPTTVLADQHHATFSERLADFPVEVASLSRFVSGARAKETIEGLARGEVDVVIGTHRILSKDVSFRRLGLVIVDEEQRFGVAHKEHFKRLRATVDVLTLTATPIPRTLHMSLSGVRDISALSEPPPGREEIATRVAWRHELPKAREALLAEKNRGGQAFFLHNRVTSIERVARMLADLVPECTFAVGHGQMTARELKRVMDAFTRGEVDVLVATSIIENGVDIPSAGTILIDEAERFGLAELHQLRGRVGRGSARASCWLLVDRDRPLSRVARERLAALEEMTQLGAGFGISMKDLELRGAGNILGPEQSGHIAAVGYDMYCKLLKRTVDRLKAGEAAGAREEGFEPGGVELELGLAAYLPEEWLPDADRRLELLRRLDEVAGPEEAAEAESMLRDRYGRVPAPVQALLRTLALRADLVRAGVRRLAWRDDSYLLEYEDRVRLESELDTRGVEVRPLAAGRARLVVPPELRDPERALDWLEGLLKGRTAAPKMTAPPSDG